MAHGTAPHRPARKVATPEQREEWVASAAQSVREQLLWEPRYSREALRERVAGLAREYFRQRFLPQAEAEELSTAVVWEIAGFGPLESLLGDEAITDILVNGPGQVYIRQGAGFLLSPVRFRSESHLREIVDRIIEPLGRRLDESTPCVDGRLPEGHRVHAIIPPLARGGTCLSIRLFRRRRWSLPELAANGAMDGRLLAFLTAAVQGAASMVISGGTGAGKSTLMAALAGLVPAGERLVVVEDSGELLIHHPHVVYLECRSPNTEGRGGVGLWDLVRQALRMAPTRILVGEVRGPEALALLDAINTGHRGSLATVHANSPGHALDRLASLVARALPGMAPANIRTQMMGSLDLVLQLTQGRDGVRRVAEVAEVMHHGGDPDAALALRPVFSWTGQGYRVSPGPPAGWAEWAQVAGLDGGWPPAPAGPGTPAVPGRTAPDHHVPGAFENGGWTP